ncbi:MAG: class I SAM-dependent methyltransferase [Candidatus Hadarchaeum sp.]|uniref:class I SAM-dependent methyltransferase n=1 Tax=Candidatus Hadarchaeum sp. TaxID=2883567 RepID=UPI003D14A1A3
MELTTLRELLRGTLTESELRLLPKRFKRIGHVAILNLPKDLFHRNQEIAQRTMDFTGAKTVAINEGKIEGRFREPRLRVIAGDPNTETVHVENGCQFRLDVARVMFSPGNVHERGRVAHLVSPDEVVVDMFAGVGQFSIPIAVHARPSLVYSIEINQVAFNYLLENIRINKVGHILRPILGDCSEVAPRGVADRVIMGILHVTHRYLPLAMKVLKPEGGVIHYHETVPSRLGFKRPVERIIRAASGREVEIINQRVVKRYSPGVDHVVVDAKIGKKK